MRHLEKVTVTQGYYLRLKTGIVDGELHQRHFFQPWSGVIISEIKTVPPAVPYNHDVNRTHRREKRLDSLREALGEDAFNAAWDAGRAMPWEQAVDYALAGPDGDAEPRGTPSSPRPAAPL